MLEGLRTLDNSGRLRVLDVDRHTAAGRLQSGSVSPSWSDVNITLFPTGLDAVKVSWNLPSFISASNCFAHFGSAVTYLEVTRLRLN